MAALQLIVLVSVLLLAFNKCQAQYFSTSYSQISHHIQRDGRLLKEHLRHLHPNSMTVLPPPPGPTPTHGPPGPQPTNGPPPPPGPTSPGPQPTPDIDSGVVKSDECTIPDGTDCEKDGSSNYEDIKNLTYNSRDGKFYGTFITNECNDKLREYSFCTANCEQQTIPAPFATNPGPTPVLGRLGMTLSGGVNIYSAFEAGFQDCSKGQPCACYGASCPGGMDIKTCEAHLYYACTSDVNYEMFLDSCGGHARPYHIHSDPVCNYNSDTPTGHSEVLGVSLDGYGIYGKFETTNKRPCDLDACHGHVGPVPSSDTYNISVNNVYHYHVQDTEVYPYTWTIGCYGDPNDFVDVDQCKKLYPDYCGDDSTSVETVDGNFTVDLYCPCYENIVEGCD